MSGAGALNLSLLSRGVGEVQKNGHEKVEVFLEPSDYLNFGPERPYYLPPLTNTYHFPDGSPRLTARSARDVEIALPKTFTTRKGALLLFSEDLALKTQERHERHTRRRHHPTNSSFTTHSSSIEDETAVVLKTVDDLAKSILRYGARDYDEDHNKMHLKFLHRRREQWERQIRPGYSAKRYLSTWTRNWDDQVFETVVSKGYLTERSLFHYNLFVPNVRRHLFHEDLSGMPQPYRLMKNMLLTPGSLSGYTFYRTPTATDFGAAIEEEREEGERKRPDTMRSIRVIRTTKDGQQKEVSYSTLDKETQKEVITDLLVKSAVHYALSKQEEIIEESIAQAMKSDQVGIATSYQLTDPRQVGSAQKSVPGFDMREAVDSLLDSHRGPYQLGADLPEFDSHSHSSEQTGSFRGGSVPHHAIRGTGVGHTPRGSWPVGLEEGGKEYVGGLPVAGIRDLSATSSSTHSSVPQLPPIKAPLSPIRDVSRETTQLLTLPPIHQADGVDSGSKEGASMPTVHVMPPTPQQSSLALTTPRGPITPRAGAELHHISEAEAPTAADVSGYHISNESSPTTQGKSTGRRSKTKGQPPIPAHHLSKGLGVQFQPPERSVNQQSHNAFSGFHPHHPMTGSGWEFGRATEGQPHLHRPTARSMIGGESRSLKGSMIMAPDGEIISVGGSVIPPRPVDVGIISDVTGPQHVHDANMTDESGVSDDEPDEWRTGRGRSKARTMSSKKSDSLKKHRKDSDSDSLASSSLQIDYTSGDIDATMSIHSWSYAPKGEGESENGMVKTGSVRSLPAMSGDGGMKSSLSTTDHDRSHEDGAVSGEEDNDNNDRWARITERPEEEEATTMFGSREPTQDALQQGQTPRPPTQKTATPGATRLTPGGGKTPAVKSKTPAGAKVTAGEFLETPAETGPRPSPASVSIPSHESDGGDIDDDNREDETGTTRSRSVALQTDSSSPVQTPRIHTSTPRKSVDSQGHDSGAEDGGKEAEEGWLATAGKDMLDIVPEESHVSQKSSAAPSRLTSALDQQSSQPPTRAQTAEEAAREESRKSSSQAGKTRAASSKKASSRTGSAVGESDADQAQPELEKVQSMIREETTVTETSQAEIQQSTLGELPEREEQKIDGQAEPAERSSSKERAHSRSDKTGSKGSRAAVEASPGAAGTPKTGPSPQSKVSERVDSKTSGRGSKTTSRGPSQTSRAPSKEPGSKSAAEEARASGKTSSKGDKSRGPSSKMSQRTPAKSRSKDPSRSQSTRLSESKLETPAPDEEAVDHQWEDEAAELSDAGGDDLYRDDFKPPSTPSSATEAEAKVSGEEPPPPVPLSVEGTQLLSPPSSPTQGRRTRLTVQESVTEEPERASQPRSSITEQDILDTLTDHAKRIAESVLSHDRAGQDLETDVRYAADMWMEAHPTRSISRSQSVQDAIKSEAIGDIMKAQRRASSAGPSAAEYKDLIRQSLTTAVAKAAGLDPEQFPEDVEISPDLLEALANQKLTPDDITIIRDEETGRPVIKSRAEIQQMMGGVQEGHIYVAPNGKGGSHAGSEAGGLKRQISIPADRASLADNMEYDVISYGGTEVVSERGRGAGRSKAGSKPGSIAGGTIADLSEHPAIPATAAEGEDQTPEEPEDEFQKAIQQMNKDGDVSSITTKTPSAADGAEGQDAALPPGESAQLELDLESEKSQKTAASEESKKGKGKGEKEEPFVVGKVDRKGELEKLYGPVDLPPPKHEKEKGDKSPRQSDKSPRLSDKSDKSPRLSEKDARPEPVGQDKPEAAGPGTAGKDAELPKEPSPVKETPKPAQSSPTKKKGKPAKKEKAKPPDSKPSDSKPSESVPASKPTEQVKGATTGEKEVPAETAGLAVTVGDAAKADDGVVDHKDELKRLYGGTLPQLPKTEAKSPVKVKPKAKKEPEKKGKKGKKGKGKKGKKEEEPAPEPEPEPEPEPPAPVEKEPEPAPPPAPATPRQPTTAGSSDRLQSSPELKTDDEMEFTIVREESSPEPERPQKFSIPPTQEEEEEEEELEPEDDEDDANLKSISNREARAAKRAAAAAKRKEEVERRRKEREEQLKREKEEQERQEQLRREMEEERRRREEERRRRKEKEAEEEDREEQERLEQERRRQLEQDREKRAKEEYQRKLEEMKRKQAEEEARRAELLLQKQKEEEARRLEEELLMSQMAEQERLEYERKKREEEEERKRKEEEERIKRELEAKKAMEEARRLAEEMARKQAELEARLKFNRALQMEANGLDHSHDINRAFVFSYFELLQWLGLDIPEFELAKMSQF